MKNGWTICKQWRPWPDAAFCGIWSGSALFASYPFRGLQSSMGLTDQNQLYPSIHKIFKVFIFMNLMTVKQKQKCYYFRKRSDSAWGGTRKIIYRLALNRVLHHENTPIFFDPLKPHFYVVKLGFTGVYIIFLIFAQKHRLWVLVRTASARRF